MERIEVTFFKYVGKGMAAHSYSCLQNPMDRRAWWAAVYGGHKESDTTEVT